MLNQFTEKFLRGRLKRAGRLATAPGSWQADAFLVAKVIASSGYKGSLRRVAGI